MRSTVLKNLKKTIVLAGVGTVFIGYNSSQCPTTNKRKLNMFGEELRESGSAFLLRTVLAPYVSLATLPAGAKNNRELLTSVMIQSFLKGKEMSEELPAYERLDNITNRLLDNNPELTKDSKPNIHITAKNDMPAFSLADHIVISLDFLNKSSDDFEGTVEMARGLAGSENFYQKVQFVTVDTNEDDHRRVIEYLGLKGHRFPNMRIVQMKDDIEKYRPIKVNT